MEGTVHMRRETLDWMWTERYLVCGVHTATGTERLCELKQQPWTYGIVMGDDPELLILIVFLPTGSSFIHSLGV